ncbi:MAG TPA: hypothetical protein PKC43_02335 [Phycisphaerales bacterium]|nr:hypothetical protein [Phycisphaerales bacterium]HMP36263.1 hypothetical protein [Phycisphaerales bacterium]
MKNQIPSGRLLCSRSLAVALCAAAGAGVAEAQSLASRLDGVARMRQGASQATAVSKAQLLGALLYTDLTVDFVETPAREAFNYVRSQLGVDLVVRWSTDRGATVGIDPDSVISLRADSRPALTVIEMMLDQLQDLDPLSWQLRDGFIEVGPKARLDNAVEVRYYPVRDLLFEPSYFDNAPEFDLDAALNQGEQGGGGGGGSGGGGGGFGGGGGGGSGGGGGGGGGSGGSIFGSPGDDPTRRSDAELAEELIEIIQQTIEPQFWDANFNAIRYYQGVFIVRAPDYVHRALGGYPFAPRPPRPQASATTVIERRYVTFTTPISIVQNPSFGTTTVTGAAGGTGP